MGSRPTVSSTVSLGLSACRCRPSGRSRLAAPTGCRLAAVGRRAAVGLPLPTGCRLATVGLRAAVSLPLPIQIQFLQRLCSKLACCSPVAQTYLSGPKTNLEFYGFHLKNVEDHRISELTVYKTIASYIYFTPVSKTKYSKNRKNSVPPPAGGGAPLTPTKGGFAGVRHHQLNVSRTTI